MRGVLLCLVATALGAPLAAALPRAVAIELIHTASLIHDDVVDQHRERREVPAAWTLIGARRAVLLGDVIFSSALREMCELGREDGVIASRAIAEVARGAYREPLDPAEVLAALEARYPGADYLRIINLKTGVLFGAACELGALAAGADQELRQALLRFGLRIGEAYQVADDLQEVEKALITRSLAPEELAQLAPALLFFRAGCRRWLLDAMTEDGTGWNAETEGELSGLADSMHAEKEKMLQAAADELAGRLPGQGELVRLVRAAPRDMVRMFDAQAAQAFSQLSAPQCPSPAFGG